MTNTPKKWITPATLIYAWFGVIGLFYIFLAMAIAVPLSYGLSVTIIMILLIVFMVICYLLAIAVVRERGISRYPRTFAALATFTTFAALTWATVTVLPA